MIRRPIALAVLATALLAPAPRTEAARTRGPAIVAHRGAWGHAPENTIVAFRKALRLGATTLEMDVRLAGPGRRGSRPLVVIHDATLDRTTDCRGAVRETPLRRIRRCDAGWGAKGRDDDRRWAGRGIRVPTLARVLRRFPRTSLIVDVKPRAQRAEDAADVPATAHAVAGLLARRDARGDRGIFGRVLVSSFGSDVLTLVRTIEPRVRTALLSEPPAEGVATTALRAALLGHQVAVPSVRSEDLRAIVAVRQAGQTVYVHTADRMRRIRRLIRLGVDGIYTNYPERVRRALRQPLSSSRACLTSICI